MFWSANIVQFKYSLMVQNAYVRETGGGVITILYIKNSNEECFIEFKADSRDVFSKQTNKLGPDTK